MTTKDLIIKQITPMDNFTIEIELSNGKNFIFDFNQYLEYPFAKKLQDLNFFKTAKFKGELIYWNDMLDFPLHCMDIPEEIKAS